MPIDPYAALNAMLRAEVSRFAPPVRQAEPITPPKTPAPAVEDEGDPQETAVGSASARPVAARSAAGDSAA
ncbi:hypothetical protein ACIRS3_19710 [Streptomyces virginiae]|uniref:hypothetical protein n=1 Tax=Streptomyces virginiae TaxID=1961 RepID=UPI0037F36CD7